MRTFPKRHNRLWLATALSLLPSVAFVQAFTVEPDLCAFIQKIAADHDDDFSAFRGVPNPDKSFKGIVRLDSAQGCIVKPRNFFSLPENGLVEFQPR